MLQRWRHRKRCRTLAGICDDAVMSQYLEQCARLDPGNIADTPLISVDLELTGLDPASDQIISIGWTQVDGGRIRFGSNRHLLISADQSVGSSDVDIFPSGIESPIVRGRGRPLTVTLPDENIGLPYAPGVPIYLAILLR